VQLREENERLTSLWYDGIKARDEQAKQALSLR
jgi:hypothetical protein